MGRSILFAWDGGLSEVVDEPLARQPGHLCQSAWFLKQVRGPRNDCQLALRSIVKLLVGSAIQVDDGQVPTADNQQRRRLDTCQFRPG
jgi:hypothetical protein